MNTLTNSSIGTFLECPQKFNNAYAKRLRPRVTPEYFRLGHAYHLAHEIYGKTGNFVEALEVVVRNYENPPEWAMSSEEALSAWHYEGATAIELFRGHVGYWDGHGDGLQIAEVIATEQVFTVAIRDPRTGNATPRFRRQGMIDKIVRLTDGRLAIWDYKTVGADIGPGSDFWAQLRIDSQPSGYFLAAREMGYDVKTIVYDAARKPGIRPGAVPLLDADGFKQVFSRSTGERLRTKDNRKWRESASGSDEYMLTRPMLLDEWAEKLRASIAEKPEWYYQRSEIVRMDDDLDAYQSDLWSQQRTIAEAMRLGRFYKNTRSCTSRGVCPYFGLCTGRVDESAFRVADVEHEELG